MQWLIHGLSAKNADMKNKDYCPRISLNPKPHVLNFVVKDNLITNSPKSQGFGDYIRDINFKEQSFAGLYTISGEAYFIYGETSVKIDKDNFSCFVYGQETRNHIFKLTVDDKEINIEYRPPVYNEDYWEDDETFDVLLRISRELKNRDELESWIAHSKSFHVFQNDFKKQINKGLFS